MQDLTEHFLELIRLAATSLPPDVESALRSSIDNESEGSSARSALETILKTQGVGIGSGSLEAAAAVYAS